MCTGRCRARCRREERAEEDGSGRAAVSAASVGSCSRTCTAPWSPIRCSASLSGWWQAWPAALSPAQCRRWLAPRPSPRPDAAKVSWPAGLARPPSQRPITPLAAVVGGLLAGVVGTICLDTAGYLRYRRSGGEKSPLEWEFGPIDGWENGPDPGKVAKREIEGFTQRELLTAGHGPSAPRCTGGTAHTPRATVRPGTPRAQRRGHRQYCGRLEGVSA